MLVVGEISVKWYRFFPGEGRRFPVTFMLIHIRELTELTQLNFLIISNYGGDFEVWMLVPPML